MFFLMMNHTVINIIRVILPPCKKEVPRVLHSNNCQALQHQHDLFSIYFVITSNFLSAVCIPVAVTSKFPAVGSLKCFFS